MAMYLPSGKMIVILISGMKEMSVYLPSDKMTFVLISLFSSVGLVRLHFR